MNTKFNKAMAIVLFSSTLCLVACSKKAATESDPPVINPPDTDTIPVISTPSANNILVFGNPTNVEHFIHCYNSDLSSLWAIDVVGRSSQISYYNNYIFSLSIVSSAPSYYPTSYLTKINPSNGNVEWQRSFTGRSSSAMSVSGDSLILSTHNVSGTGTSGELIVLSTSSGNLLSTINMQGEYRPSYVTADGRSLYFYATTLTALASKNAYSLTTNSFTWSSPISTSSIANSETRLHSCKNILVSSSALGDLVAIDKSNGNEVWRNFYPGASLTTEAVSPPIVQNDLIYTRLHEGAKVVALEPETGIAKWEWKNSGNTFIWKRNANAEGKNLFFIMVQNVQPNVQFVALNAVTGNQYYRKTLPFFLHDQLVTAGHYSYVFSNDDNRSYIPNTPTKFLKIDNITGNLIDSAMIPYGKILAVF